MDGTIEEINGFPLAQGEELVILCCEHMNKKEENGKTSQNTNMINVMELRHSMYFI